MKMKVIWTGEGREPREWVVDRGDPAWHIAYPVEKQTDWGWLQFLERLDAMSAIAWRALLWALRKETETRLPIEAVEVIWSELDLFVLCPGCEEWVRPQDHECDYSAIQIEVDDDGDIEVVPAEPKKAAKKKPGESDPEA